MRLSFRCRSVGSSMSWRGGGGRHRIWCDGRDPLVVTQHGAVDRLCAVDDPPHLACLRVATAPFEELLAVERPVLRREGSRYCRALSQSAGTGVGPVRRREEPDPGPRQDPAAVADAPRSGRTAQPRLQTPRHPIAVRRSRHRDRPGPRPLLRPPPRWQAHYTPTSASWINQVERFFALLTEKQLRRGVHRSTKELKAVVLRHMDTVNADPKPFRWTRSADDILASIKRSCLADIRIAEHQ